MQRVVGLVHGGGETQLSLKSTWIGNVRWARNRISSESDIRSNEIHIARRIHGAPGAVRVNMIDDASLEQAVRRAEHARLLMEEHLASEPGDDYREPMTHPKIWFDTTYHLDAGARVALVRDVIAPIEQTGMLSAGYVEVKAMGQFVHSTRSAYEPLYYPYTAAQFSLTVRDPKGTGSGWAGVDWSDWSRINAPHLAQIALEKCLRSRNPVAVEPGRYTTILEPQAVGDLLEPLFNIYTSALLRSNAEKGDGPFAGRRTPLTKIGEQVLDNRLTITADPMDPDLGFPPFSVFGQQQIYHPVTWVEHGVLRHLSYSRDYAMEKLRLNSSIANSGAFHMTGGTTSVDEMIQTTKRGLLVTRFSGVQQLDARSVLCAGYTRDGLWLIENGKISKAVKNFRFTESPLFVFNQVEQLGVPQRIFHPEAPIVVPPAKVRDFSFTSLADAV
jgi:predicted Zn-dependent protease